MPKDYRAAMIVTKAPAEPFEVVRQTLEAMLLQSYPHDTWLADEDPSDGTIAWCRHHGVRISTRKGHDDYHRLSWPRRTRCKEGNLAFFYDHYGYTNYDVVVQMDADHVPEVGYLEEMLRPFVDPAVGYVSAPSICDRNAKESWSARGRLNVEGIMHGALQSGYTGCLAPMCIGSHYAVRTAALKQIGGLGPDLAEDHSTSLIMNAHGWKGVHAINAIARGYGPDTFADLATQEFQWSRSLMFILLKYTPNYFRPLPTRLKFQFAFCQTWYPAISLIMISMYLMPIYALLTDSLWVGVTYFDFFLHMFAMSVPLTAIAFFVRKVEATRPEKVKILNWESAIFIFARWPWVSLGALAAIWDRLAGTKLDFRVTPKGQRAAESLSLRVLAPYLILSAGSALPVVMLSNIQNASGFYFLAILNSLIYAIVAGVAVARHWRENVHREIKAPGFRSAMAVSFGAAALVLAISFVAIPLRGPQGVQAILWGADKHFVFNAGQALLDVFPEARATGLVSAKAGDGKIGFGVYDPGKMFPDTEGVSIQHFYVPWNAPDAWGSLSSKLENAERRNRRVLATVEPWTKADNWTDGSGRLFDDILVGQYDEEIDIVCGELKQSRDSVLVRWGHEMEGPTDRYPWAQKNPAGYTQAYRYFVKRCRATAPTARFVWSPIGHSSLNRYYPGNSYVDYIGLSLYGLEDWDMDEHGRPRSFSESLLEKYNLIAPYEKDIIVAELGFCCSHEYSRSWLKEMASDLSKFPLLRALVYFNSKETYRLPLGYGSPDWRLDKKIALETLFGSSGAPTSQASH